MLRPRAIRAPWPGRCLSLPSLCRRRSWLLSKAREMFAPVTEGGLGIAIIRTIADEFELQSKPGVRGSRLRFVKRLRQSA